MCVFTVPTCNRIEYKETFEDAATGCRSRKRVTHRQCVGGCGAAASRNNNNNNDCCVPKKIKTRRVRVFCADGSSEIAQMPVIRKCGCKDCSSLANNPLLLNPGA